MKTKDKKEHKQTFNKLKINLFSTQVNFKFHLISFQNFTSAVILLCCRLSVHG
jgi:hypothetical protein